MTRSESTTSENRNLAQTYHGSGGRVSMVRGFVETVGEIFGRHANLSSQIQGILTHFNDDLTSIASAKDSLSAKELEEKLQK